MVTLFFTSMMNNGQPVEMPVGVVDLDNTATTRALIRKLDAFQTSKVVANYGNMNEARNAIQRNKIYAFIYFPKGTTEALLSARQPKISFYYTMTSLTAGSLLFRDLKTISTLGSAAVGQATLTAKGLTPGQIKTFLQPIAIDLHLINNPTVDYNMYLSNMLIPGCLMLFIFLITAYSIGTELKFKRSKEWLAVADNNIYVALIGKLLPQFLVFLTVMYGYMYYTFGVLQFPHPGGTWHIMLLGFLAVVSSQGFGAFAFGRLRSLAVGSAELHHVGHHLPLVGHGSAFRNGGTNVPSPSLLHDLPNQHLQRLSAHRCVVQCHGTGHLCVPSALCHEEYP